MQNLTANGTNYNESYSFKRKLMLCLVNFATYLQIAIATLAVLFVLAFSNSTTSHAQRVNLNFKNQPLDDVTVSEGTREYANTATKNKQLFIHVGVADSFPQIPIDSWMQGSGFTGYFQIKEFTRDCPTCSERQTAVEIREDENQSTNQINFRYIIIRQHKSTFNSQWDSLFNAEVYPQATINEINNQVIRYTFETWNENYPTITSEIELVISRRQVAIDWKNSSDPARFEITSGEYVSGTTNYKDTIARAYTSESLTNIVIRVSEQFNTQPKKSHHSVNDTRTTSAYIGRVNSGQFRFGEWRIDTFGQSGRPNNPCVVSDHAVYINCFNLVFLPDKTEIDNLRGTVVIKLEIGYIENGVELTNRIITLTINGQAHTIPHLSLRMDDDTARGITESQLGRVGVYSSKPISGTLVVWLDVTSTGEFYNGTAIGVTLSNGNTHKFGLIFPVRDNVEEMHGSITLTIRTPPKNNPKYALSLIPSDNSVTFTVYDDEILAISIRAHPNAEHSVLELPTSFALFEITSDQPTSVRLEVNYEFAGNNQFRDFNVAPPEAIYIEAGKTTGILAIKTQYEPNQNTSGSISVRLVESTSPYTYSIPNAPAERISTINVLNNNQSIVLSITTANFNVAENVEEGNFVINLELSHTAKLRTIFSLEVGGGTAKKHLDYLDPILAEHSISVGNKTLSITIPILDDDNREGNETFNVKLSNLVGANFVNYVSEQNLEITIIDTEKPILTFSQSSINLDENDEIINLSFNLTGPIDSLVEIFYNITEVTATAATDFTDISNGLVTIPANTTSIPIKFQIMDDVLSEGDETFKIVVPIPPTNAVFPLGKSTLEATVTIYDDEPILLSATTTDFTVPENVVGGYFIIDLQLTSAVADTNSATTRVSYETTVSSGTATLGEDFMEPERTQKNFNIDLATNSQTIPILNDIENEGNENFSVTLSNLTGANFANGKRELMFEITIIDNEKPTLTFTEKTYSITEDDTDTNIELILMLSGPIESPVDISYDTFEVTATADVDFTNVSDGIATVAVNTTSVSINIQIKGDNLNEGSETFSVIVAVPPTNAVFSGGVSELVATITITDDELPTLSVDNSTLLVSESAGTTHISLNLSGPTSNMVVVTYSTSITGNDTAQQADFTAQSASTTTIATSPPPATSGLIQIPINNDTDEEEDETFTLTLTGITGAVFADDQNIIVVQVTIIDNEGLPILSIDSTEISANEHSGYAEIGLSFTPPITEPVTLVYSTIQGTAIGGADYTASSNVAFEIATGNKETIFIPITNDNIYEGEEEFSMEISAISGAAYGSGVINSPIMITLADDETEPTITISAYSCEYGEPIPTNFSINESVGNLIFNAKLSHPSQIPVNFNYVTTPDTATSADFYANSTTQFTIQPGRVCTEIVTPITHDALYEPDEQFEVAFTSESGANIIAPFRVKIEDDDVALWNIDDLAMDEGDSNTEMAFRVNLSTPVFQATRVKWTASTTAGNTAVLSEDYAPDHNSHTGYVSIAAGQTFNYIGGLETTGDTIFEPDETFTVILSNPEGGTQLGDGVAIGTIINDDPKPTLSISTISQIGEN